MRARMQTRSAPRFIRSIPSHEKRSPERLIAHYLAEKALAEKLRRAKSQERRALYPKLYDELFQSVPDLPFLEENRHRATRELACVKPYLKPSSRFLEVGCGGGHLTRAVAAFAESCIALDVSAASQREGFPENVRFETFDGVTIPLEDESIGVAYSNQVIEHLHPDDASIQIQEIYRVLAPGGIFICRTPNRLTGPHDVSRCFDEMATGFHLKEYTLSDLSAQLSKTGFRDVRKLFCEKGIYLGDVKLPLFLAAEAGFGFLPFSIRKVISNTRLMDIVINVTLLARK